MGTALQPAVMTRRWDIWGALAGMLLGLVDTAAVLALGVEMWLDGTDMRAWVMVFFGLNYAILGFLIGRLAMARARARRDAETITHQIAELELSQRAAAQHEKMAALGQLAAGIAHEVRNPLGVIRASASMIGEELPEQADSSRACHFIIEEIDRLDGLIGSLLSFARPAELRLRPVQLESVVDRAVQLAGDETRRRGIDVDVDLDAMLPEVVADPDLVSQVILGLLLNAAEAIERDGRIEVRVRRRSDRIEVEVADSGPGLEAAEVDRLFEPFYTTKDTGTGLGLAITARIIEGHGGRVDAVAGRGAAADGLGACFRIQLPLEGPRAGRRATV